MSDNRVFDEDIIRRATEPNPSPVTDTIEAEDTETGKRCALTLHKDGSITVIGDTALSTSTPSGTEGGVSGTARDIFVQNRLTFCTEETINRDMKNTTTFANDLREIMGNWNRIRAAARAKFPTASEDEISAITGAALEKSLGMR